jgi:hypothetical protein
MHNWFCSQKAYTLCEVRKKRFDRFFSNDEYLMNKLDPPPSLLSSTPPENGKIVSESYFFNFLFLNIGLGALEGIIMYFCFY